MEFINDGLTTLKLRLVNKFQSVLSKVIQNELYKLGTFIVIIIFTY